MFFFFFFLNSLLILLYKCHNMEVSELDTINPVFNTIFNTSLGVGRIGGRNRGAVKTRDIISLKFLRTYSFAVAWTFFFFPQGKLIIICSSWPPCFRSYPSILNFLPFLLLFSISVDLFQVPNFIFFASLHKNSYSFLHYLLLFCCEKPVKESIRLKYLNYNSLFSFSISAKLIFLNN